MRSNLVPRHRRTGRSSILNHSLILAAALWLAACGGSTNESEAPTPDAASLGNPVTQTVGPTGGTVEATTMGVKLRLTFPADALPADTTVRITPVSPADGDSASVRLEPAGTMFRKPVAVVLEYPAGRAPNAGSALRQSLGGADVLVSTVVDTAARTLSATLTTFGGSSVQAQAAVAHRAQALRTHPLVDPFPEDYGTLSAQDIAGVGHAVQLARERIELLQQRGLYADALAAQLSIAELVQRTGEDGYSAQALPFLEAAAVTACEALQAAIAASRQAPISAPGDFKPIVAKLMYWDFLVHRLGGNGCSGVSALDASHQVIARELTLAQNNFVAATTPAQIQSQAADIRDARNLQAEAAGLQATDASGTTLQLQAYGVALRDELIDPSLTPARNAAWGQARTNGTLMQYVPLIEAYGAPAVLQQDVQYFRTAPTVTVKNGSGTVTGTAALGIQSLPEQPTDPVRNATLNARGGTIEIGGSIAALACPNSDSETLIVSFDGVEVARTSSFGDTLLSGTQPLQALSAAALLQAAHLAADDVGSHVLTIARHGAACSATFGLADETLATVTLNFAQATLSVTFVGTVTIFTSCNGFINGTYPADATISQPSANSGTGFATGHGGRGGYANLSDTPKTVAISGDLGTIAQVTLPSGMVLSINGNTATGSRTESIDECGDPPRPGTIYRETVSLTRQ